MRLNIFKPKHHDQDFEPLKSRLEQTLRPIPPRQEYVQELRSRLLMYPQRPTPAWVVKKKVPRGWIVAGGVAGSVLMLLMSIRGLLSLAGIIGLLVQHFKQGKGSPVSQPAQS